MMRRIPVLVALAFGAALIALAAAPVVFPERHPRLAGPPGHDGAVIPAGALVLAHGLNGSIQPCGCGGNKTGGLAGRIEVVEGLRRESPEPVVVLEGGGFLTGATDDPILLETMLAGFRAEGTAVVCLAEHEIRHAERIRGASFAVACASVAPGASESIARWCEAGGYLVTSIIDPGLVAAGEVLPVVPPESAASDYLRALHAGAAAGVVFLHGGLAARSRVLARLAAAERPLLVVDTRGDSDANRGTSRLGLGQVLRIIPDGREIAFVRGLSASGRGGASGSGPVVGRDRLEVRRLPVKSGTGAAAGELVAAHSARLRAAIDPEGRHYAGFVGSRACAACHESESRVHAASGHARAMASLELQHRAAAPECYPCHVTGNPGATPRGMVPPEAPESLREVGCESCHGPGAEHVGDHRKPMRQPTEATCRVCHLGKFDPDFDFPLRLSDATCRPSPGHAQRERRWSLPHRLATKDTPGASGAEGR